ncbi:protein-glutamate O-methyltransferase CheR [Sulfurivirga sp.]|uniref:CheR family methyltransferase n=1 Tax=Sulfurivirga sp. TaxID=2614236 RepID=UPI0025D46A4B|nr:protein-glutamate O-methyltransferase CheR [Sulfurivirga sp.]
MLSVGDFRKLCDVIYRRTGIKIDLKRYDILKPKLEKVLTQFGYSDFRSFFHDFRFEKNPALIQEILNTVTINETYFFREKYQFETLISEVLPRLHQLRPTGEPIRILCAPSSTGEEPYSIALSLLDEGRLLDARDFELVGIDIDSVAIAKARAGIYTPRSVQHVPPHLLQQYFIQRTDGRYELVDFLKGVVNFQVVNVMDRQAMRRLGRFDVIFCRNMLIYFDEISRREVAMTFYELLKPQGAVFLGHAESMNRIVSVFRTVRSGETIYYVKE